VTTPFALEPAAPSRNAPTESAAVIEDLPRPRHVRSPSDVVRLVAAHVLLIAGGSASC